MPFQVVQFFCKIRYFNPDHRQGHANNRSWFSCLQYHFITTKITIRINQKTIICLFLCWHKYYLRLDRAIWESLKSEKKNLILHVKHCNLNNQTAQTVMLMETQSRIQTSFKYVQLIPSVLPHHHPKRSTQTQNDSCRKSRILQNSSLWCDKLILVSCILFPMEISFKTLLPCFIQVTWYVAWVTYLDTGKI